MRKEKINKEIEKILLELHKLCYENDINYLTVSSFAFEYYISADYKFSIKPNTYNNVVLFRDKLKVKDEKEN